MVDPPDNKRNYFQQCPKERTRWCHSAKLMYNLQSEMKDYGNEAFWHMIHHELTQRRNINPQIKQNYQPHQMSPQQGIYIFELFPKSFRNYLLIVSQF